MDVEVIVSKYVWLLVDILAGEINLSLGMNVQLNIWIPGITMADIFSLLSLILEICLDYILLICNTDKRKQLHFYSNGKERTRAASSCLHLCSSPTFTVPHVVFTITTELQSVTSQRVSWLVTEWVGGRLAPRSSELYGMFGKFNFHPAYMDVFDLKNDYI